jgi:hypothetical protein
MAGHLFTQEGTMSQHMLEVVCYATLAANGHNTQPVVRRYPPAPNDALRL